MRAFSWRKDTYAIDETYDKRVLLFVGDAQEDDSKESSFGRMLIFELFERLASESPKHTTSFGGHVGETRVAGQERNLACALRYAKIHLE